MEAACAVDVTAIVTCVSTLALVVVTAIYATAAWKQQTSARKQLEESKQMRWDSLRPLLQVTARYTRHSTKRRVFDLENIGPGPALDIAIEVNGERIKEFYYADDPDLLGGWTAPCVALRSAGVRYFSPPPGSKEIDTFKIALSYHSVFCETQAFSTDEELTLPHQG